MIEDKKKDQKAAVHKNIHYLYHLKQQLLII